VPRQSQDAAWPFQGLGEGSGFRVQENQASRMKRDYSKDRSAIRYPLFCREHFTLDVGLPGLTAISGQTSKPARK
jgi:hypothetical protein